VGCSLRQANKNRNASVRCGGKWRLNDLPGQGRTMYGQAAPVNAALVKTFCMMTGDIVCSSFSLDFEAYRKILASQAMKVKEKRKGIRDKGQGIRDKEQ
jgi:hypothetical protein